MGVSATPDITPLYEHGLGSVCQFGCLRRKWGVQLGHIFFDQADVSHVYEKIGGPTVDALIGSII